MEKTITKPAVIGDDAKDELIDYLNMRIWALEKENQRLTDICLDL